MNRIKSGFAYMKMRGSKCCPSYYRCDTDVLPGEIRIRRSSTESIKSR